MRRLAPLLAAIAVLLLGGAAMAKGTFRTVLVIDASSSMLSTDPREIRKVAAELFVDLARDGDQIAVTGFDGAVRDSTGAFTTLKGPGDRDAVKRAIRAVGKDGAQTDFTAGLLEAKRLLDAAPDEPGDQELVVFLTDGQCDPDRKGPLAAGQPPGASLKQVCEQKVLDEVVPSLRPARVYAVGLGGAPKALLEQIGSRSGGAGVTTTKADELPRLFAEAYARVLGSKLTDGPSSESVKIQVDEGSLSLDVVVVGPPALTAILTGPSGAPVPRDNAKPGEAYFVETPSYRLYKVSRPAAGAWMLSIGGGGKGGRFVALEGLDLELSFVDLPEVVEIGRAVKLKLRLGTPAGKSAPLDFLDRHDVTLWPMMAAKGCRDALKKSATAVPLRRGADGSYEMSQTASVLGEMCFEARLVPGKGGVLTRTLASPVIRMVTPLHLKAAPLVFERIKQDAKGKATLSFAGSEIGEPIDVEWALVTRKDRLELDPEEMHLDPSGPREIAITMSVDRDARSGPIGDRLRIVPVKPKGYEDRAIEVEVGGTIVALTFWERYGFWIEVGLGAFLFLLVVLGFALPPRFRKGSVLHYKDARDPDLPRESSYPLAAKAKAGFYRGARLEIGPTGPVKKGGLVELRAGPGGAVIARPLGGAKVREVPKPDDSGFAVGEPRDVPLVKGTFRASVGARYEIDGSGFSFWYTLR